MTAALMSGRVDMQTVAMVTCVAVKVPGSLALLRYLHSNHKFFSVGTYFLPLKTLRDRFSYFGDGESQTAPHCRD